MGTLLVVVTAGAVAVLLHLLGLPWGPWVLGAAVAPTDATAVGCSRRCCRDGTSRCCGREPRERRHHPRGLRHRGRGDGRHRGADLLGCLRMLALSYLGGVAAGLVAAWLGTQVLRRVDTVVLENLVTLLVPFVAFLGAEAIGASGVLAVVAAGIVVSQVGPKLDRAETRQQVRAFWSFLTFLLNGALFVLVGIEAMVAARALDPAELLRATGVIAAVSVVLVLVRFAFLNAAGGTVWLVTRRSGGAPREGHRDRLVSGFAGFRGAVSLAMAVAVPRTLESGGAFPDRTSSSSSPPGWSSSRSSGRPSSCRRCSAGLPCPRTSPWARSVGRRSGPRSRRPSTRSPRLARATGRTGPPWTGCGRTTRPTWTSSRRARGVGRRPPGAAAARHRRRPRARTRPAQGRHAPADAGRRRDRRPRAPPGPLGVRRGRGPAERRVVGLTPVLFRRSAILGRS